MRHSRTMSTAVKATISHATIKLASDSVPRVSMAMSAIAAMTMTSIFAPRKSCAFIASSGVVARSLFEAAKLMLPMAEAKREPRVRPPPTGSST